MIQQRSAKPFLSFNSPRSAGVSSTSKQVHPQALLQVVSIPSGAQPSLRHLMGSRVSHVDGLFQFPAERSRHFDFIPKNHKFVIW